MLSDISQCDFRDRESGRGGSSREEHGNFGPHVEGERYHECTEIRPQGSIIVFPSFIAHQVTPITKGTRYSLVLWCVGHPWR